MASLNPLTRELVFKVVFYGPGLGGKTTTLQYIHAATKAEHRGKMVSLATPTDRTLYFDFLPIRVPRVRGMAVRRSSSPSRARCTTQRPGSSCCPVRTAW